MSGATPGPLPLGPHGRFELLELLGRGGMGAVYRARDHELRRDVALKVILQRTERSRARFQREGQIAASLVHPAIVRVHASGALDGFPFLACELVEGARTLGEAARERTGAQLVEWVAQAARGLGHAHRQGVVHRDVKPDNLLVDARGRLRITDFGIAAQEGLERMTRTGAVVGTPSYMPPELVTGNRQAVGPPTDVWSLGVVLYELLSGGALPFVGDDLPSLGIRIATGEPVDLLALRPDLPPDLAAVVRRCLEKDPAARFADGDALADALEAHLEGRAPALRGRRWGSAAAALALALSLLIGAWTWSAQLAPDPLPAPSSARPRADPSPTTPVGAATPRRSWSEVRELPPEAQVLAAETWLAEHPSGPGRERAEAFLRRSAHEQPARTLTLGPPHEVEVGFLPDGSLATFGGGLLAVWDLEQTEPRWRRSLAPAAGTPMVGVLPNGDLLAGSYDVPLHWLRGDALRRLDDVRPVTWDAAPDGSRVAVSARERGQLALFDAASMRAGPWFGAGDHDYIAVCFVADGQGVLASRGDVGYLREGQDALDLFDLEGQRLWTTRTPGLVRVIRRLPGGDQVLVGYNRGLIELWDLDARRAVATFEGHPAEDDGGGLLSARAVVGSVRGMQLDATRDALYVTCSGAGGAYNQLQAFSLGTRAALRAPVVRDPWNLGCSLSPDGRFLAVGSGRGVVDVWATRGLRP